jgi:hypothetical protein
MTRVLERVALLATETEIDPATGRGPEWGKAAPVALLIIVLMGIALYFLIKSMNKQMKKVPSSFDADASPDPAVEPAGDEPSADAVDHELADRVPTRRPKSEAQGARTRGRRST